MNAAQLLAEVLDEFPELGNLRWQVNGNTAITDLIQFADMHQRGNTLMITPAPDALPLINRLHDAGWKRDGSWENDGMWHLAAELSRNGATLQIHGITHTPPANGRDAIPYFADLPPELPRRMSAGFKAEYEEWERKCLEGAW